MLLKANIQVNNRLLTLYNIPNKRSEWSHLSVGYYDSEQDEIYILHQTQKNAVGVKYKVSGNLTIYVKYINQGKMTLRFRKPSHDLIVVSNEEHLKQFCKILRQLMAKNANIKGLRLTNLSNVPTKVGTKPRTKLIVNSKKDIPTLEPYPRTLQTLKLSNAGLTQLDGKIFRLQQLKVLNLENNYLTTLPEQISLLPSLKELHLAGNLLGHSSISSWLLVESLQSGLVYLDLRNNNVQTLPNGIYKLKHLQSLLLDDNLLIRLPNTFGRLDKLRELRISNNRLIVLPSSFRFLFLEFLDISCNPGWLRNNNDNNIDIDNVTTSIITLLDISAKVVVNNRLKYDEKTLPKELIAYLDSANYCICGQAAYPSKPEGHANFNLRRICAILTFTECNLPIEVRFCSDRCRTTCNQC